MIGMAVRQDDARNPKVLRGCGLDQVANVTIDCRTGIDHECRPVAAVEHVRVRSRERHRRGIGCADERYHAFSNAAGIAKLSALAAGMIVRTGFVRA